MREISQQKLTVTTSVRNLLKSPLDSLQICSANGRSYTETINAFENKLLVLVIFCSITYSPIESLWYEVVMSVTVCQWTLNVVWELSGPRAKCNWAVNSVYVDIIGEGGGLHSGGLELGNGMPVYRSNICKLLVNVFSIPVPKRVFYKYCHYTITVTSHTYRDIFATSVQGTLKCRNSDEYFGQAWNNPYFCTRGCKVPSRLSREIVTRDS